MRRSVNGWVVFLCGAVVNAKSKMMSVVALSVTEAELSAAVSCVQDMLFVKSILESLGLKVELPMIIEVDNKGGKDYIDSWSVGGRMRHIQTKFHFLRELKEQGIIAVKWISTDSNTADVFTKNLNGLAFEKHIKVFVGEDEYYAKGKDKIEKPQVCDSQGESVGLGNLLINNHVTGQRIDTSGFRRMGMDNNRQREKTKVNVIEATSEHGS